ncbi:Uncharacterized protein SCF082_LOCUS46291 [Durusdinium trenchii]|uniref:Ion transport domain-containing protein n=1 Tax=Durusdinium trenchii TaxID=1381693 RepID=A0ABP0RDZ6_9DINO
MAWLRLLASLRGYTWLGLRFLPIIKAIINSMSFFFITGMCLLASSHAYYQIGPRKEDPLPVFSAFAIPFRLGILGDFDLFEIEGTDTKYIEGTDNETNETSWEPEDPKPGDDHLFIMVVFLVTSIGITFMLVNMFIAVLTQSLQHFQSNARQLFTKSRAQMLTEMHVRPWRILRRCIDKCKETYASHSEKRKQNRDTIRTIAPNPKCNELPGLMLFWSLSPLRFVFGKYGHIWLWHQLTNRWITVLLLLLSPLLFAVSLVMIDDPLFDLRVLRFSTVWYSARVLFFGICGWKTDGKDPPEQVEAYRVSDCVIHVLSRLSPKSNTINLRQ